MRNSGFEIRRHNTLLYKRVNRKKVLNHCLSWQNSVLFCSLWDVDRGGEEGLKWL